MRAGPKRPEYEPGPLAQRLAYLIEECGEVLAAAGKSLRWGYASANPELPEDEQETNAAWLRRELADLQAAIDRVRESCKRPRNSTSTQLAAEEAARALPRKSTMRENLQYLVRRCGALLDLLGRIPLRRNLASEGVANIIPRMTDVEVAIQIVQGDVAGHPVDPRQSNETLLEEGALVSAIIVNIERILALLRDGQSLMIYRVHGEVHAAIEQFEVGILLECTDADTAVAIEELADEAVSKAAKQGGSL